MLVVIAIISILIAASIGGFSAMTKSAEKARAQELVSNVATALTAIFQQEGVWPKRFVTEGKTDGKLDAKTAYAFVSGRTQYLSLTKKGTELGGHDRFGIITPWAMQVVKRLGDKAELGTKVGTVELDKHILHFAIDLDGDGKILGANVGGESVDIRATAAVWCIGKSGGNKGDPWPYSVGRKKDDVYSWTYGQTKDVQ